MILRALGCALIPIGWTLLGMWTTYTTLYWLMIVLDRESIFHVLVP